MKQQNFLSSSASFASAVEDAVLILSQTQLFKDSFTGLVKVTNRNKVTGNEGNPEGKVTAKLGTIEKSC